MRPKGDEACPGIPRPRAGREDLAAWALSDPQPIGRLRAGRAADANLRTPNSVRQRMFTIVGRRQLHETLSR
jgi:hypothetical protein